MMGLTEELQGDSTSLQDSVSLNVLLLVRSTSVEKLREKRSMLLRVAKPCSIALSIANQACNPVLERRLQVHAAQVPSYLYRSEIPTSSTLFHSSSDHTIDPVVSGETS